MASPECVKAVTYGTRFDDLVSHLVNSVEAYMITDRGAWPSVEPSQDPTDLETDLLEGLKSRLEDTDQKVAFGILQKAGCQSDVLLQLLLRIRRSSDWQSISRNQVSAAISTLRECQDQLRLLKNSELGRHIFEHLARADRLIAEVHWVIAGAEKCKAQASGKKKPRKDDAFLGIVDYVKKTTGKYYDEQVATLMSGALDLAEKKMLTGVSLRQWRHRRDLTSD